MAFASVVGVYYATPLLVRPLCQYTQPGRHGKPSSPGGRRYDAGGGGGTHIKPGGWKRRFGERQPVCPPPGHYARLGSIAEIPPKNKFQKIREIDWGHTYTCNNLTSFQCEVNAFTGKGKYPNKLKKLARRKFVKLQQVNVFTGGF